MIIELNKILNTGLDVKEDVVLSKELYENADILDIKKLHIEGNIHYDYENNLCLDLVVDGIFLLQDSMTLEPIDYPFSTQIDEKIEDIAISCGNFYEKSKNALDISEILWENIVLEIPIRATQANREDLNLKGSGWELAQEEKEKIDARLTKLTELLEEGRE